MSLMGNLCWNTSLIEGTPYILQSMSIAACADFVLQMFAKVAHTSFGGSLSSLMCLTGWNMVAGSISSCGTSMVVPSSSERIMLLIASLSFV
ncbi:MAG: YiiD C-terminal domain-containing protein [Nitrososphaera sp.]